MMINKKKTWSIYILMVLLLLLGLGGIGGGIIMLMDPSGKVLGLPAGLLDDLFISDFFWPGIFLIVMMGFTPYILFYGIWKGYPWARPGMLAQGALLVGWIIFQIHLMGGSHGNPDSLSDLWVRAGRFGLAALKPRIPFLIFPATIPFHARTFI